MFNLKIITMRQITVTIGQSFEATRKGEKLQTEVKLNAASFEVENIESIDIDKLAHTFTNALLKRYEARNAGVRLQFAVSQPINLKIKVDGVLAFDLGFYAAQSGFQIKFPSHLAKTDKKAAYRMLSESFLYAVSAGKEFAQEAQDAIVLS